MPPGPMLVRVAIAIATTANAATTNRTAESSSGGAPVTPSFPVIHDPLHASATANAASGVTNERGTRERYEARMRRGARAVVTGINGFAGRQPRQHPLPPRRPGHRPPPHEAAV